MKKLVERLSEYKKTHQNQISKYLHFAGVPLLIFSGLILLGWVRISIPNVYEISFAWIAIILSLIYYFFLDIIIALVLTVVLGLFGYLASFLTVKGPSLLSFKFFFWTFLIGIFCQIIAHIFEGKLPRLGDMKQMMIAPVFIVTELLFMLGFKSELKRKIVAGDPSVLCNAPTKS